MQKPLRNIVSSFEQLSTLHTNFSVARSNRKFTVKNQGHDLVFYRSWSTVRRCTLPKRDDQEKSGFFGRIGSKLKDFIKPGEKKPEEIQQKQTPVPSETETKTTTDKEKTSEKFSMDDLQTLGKKASEAVSPKEMSDLESSFNSSRTSGG
eukprot:TRINITY_DN8494_c0_g1_i1.p1 TRINITY_DN8494_c0_g1~~TRINITY_DN8494_c0_g1_i1.p1  ORF type:complete len:150 (+),score=20.86 TRINITY_DN8494_c0_g1_i1:74-523(+)